MISLKKIYESFEAPNRIEWVVYYGDNTADSGDIEEDKITPERLKEIIEETLRELVEREAVGEKTIGDYSFLMRLPKPLLDGEKEQIDDLLKKNTMSIVLYGDDQEYLKIDFKDSELDDRRINLEVPFTVSEGEALLPEVIDAFGDTEMIQLKEVDYKDIYSDEALSSIQKKSEEILNKRLKGKSVSSANMDAGRIIMPILMAERQNKEYLEALAVDIVEKMYPTLFKVAPLEIDAKIVQPGSPEMSLSPDSGQEELSSDNIDIDSIDLPGEKKRRVIRSITQGASIYGSESYKLFSDIIDQLDPKLVEMYNSVIDDAYGVYFQDKLESLIDSIKGGSSNQGGESEVFTEEDSNGDNTYTIKARAIIFPILVQEIIKGVYEFLSFFGMGDDPEAAQAVADKDKTEYEPEDIKNGTILYDFVKDFLIDNNIIDVDDSKTSTEDKIATFFREVMYAMEEDDMIKLADDIISGKVSSSDITNMQKLSKDIY